MILCFLRECLIAGCWGERHWPRRHCGEQIRGHEVAGRLRDPRWQHPAGCPARLGEHHPGPWGEPPEGRPHAQVRTLVVFCQNKVTILALIAGSNSVDHELLILTARGVCRYAELVYNGLWFSPERRALQAAIDETQKYNTGTVRVKLYKASTHFVTGFKSLKWRR